MPRTHDRFPFFLSLSCPARVIEIGGPANGKAHSSVLFYFIFWGLKWCNKTNKKWKENFDD